MQFLTSLFGESGSTILTAVFALGIVIILIVLGVWLLKVLFKASGNVGRGRNRRLSVVDSLAIDPKRQLLIVRRDNVDHLILTGGSQDLVIETGIPVEVQPVRLPVRRPAPNPVPQRAAAPAQAQRPQQAEPAPAQPEPKPASSVSAQRLQELAQPAGQRKSASLRHTGLMRPVSRMEPPVIAANFDNSEQIAPDSARKAELSATDNDHGGDDDRQAAGGDGNYDRLQQGARKLDGA